MYLFSIAVIDKVAKESRSGMADSPVVPYRAPRKLNWFRNRPAQSLCEAEPRDRSPQVAGAARTC
jgi:hypothetical protein